MVSKSAFSGLFGRSPIKPLQKHIEVATECAGLVVELFEIVCSEDQSQLKPVIEQIFALESKADDIKNELREHLPRSLFMPVDRRDLLEVLDLQDSIADAAQDIAGMLQVRKFEIPADLKKPLIALTRRSLDACNQATTIINELDELVATGFRGRESEIVIKMINELNEIESDGDQMGADLVRGLFKYENEISPVSLLLLYQLVQMIGNLADYAEMVGNRVRLMLAR